MHVYFYYFINITDLQTSILSLDFRVTVLEENGGGNGNSSVAELEVRVETLEGTAADHDTRLAAAETDIEGKFFNLLYFDSSVFDSISEMIQ